jgi:hypothetical protein
MRTAGSRITVLEGWANGPAATHPSRWDPAELSAVVPDLVAKAAPNADALGNRPPTGLRIPWCERPLFKEWTG